MREAPLLRGTLPYRLRQGGSRAVGVPNCKPQRRGNRARRAAGGIAAVRSARNLTESSASRWFARSWRSKLQALTSREPRPASCRGHSRGTVCEEPHRIDCAKVVRAQLAFQIASPNVTGTAPGQRPPRNANRTERFSKATLLPFLSFGTSLPLSSRNESRRPPRRRNLTKEISPISPKAKIIAHTHFCVSAQKCVCDNIRSPRRTHS